MMAVCRYQGKIIFFYCISLSVTLGGCKNANSLSEGQKDTSPAVTPDVASYGFDKSKTVCDPLDESRIPVESSNRAGLQGRLFHIPEGQPHYSKVRDYIHNGVDTDMTLFLDDVNVPTRLFSKGFQAANGQILQVNQQTLVEYFAIYLESQLQLGLNDKVGKYQLAILSDDGAIVSLDRQSDDTFVDSISNDGDHPTRMACAMEPLDLQMGQRIPLRIEYYQGPRYHISFVMMWRPWPQGSAVDPLCGQQGNSLFFDFNKTPSEPQKAYKDLLARGWKPLTSDNFVVPGQSRINPCTDPNFSL